MAYPIKYLSLQKPELEYEVSVRGYTPGESVQDLRKQIVKIANELPPEDILESYLEPAEDLKCVKESLNKALNNVVALRSRFEKNLFLRTETLLNHIYHRINRISHTPDTAELFKINYSNFKSLFKEIGTMKSHISLVTPDKHGESSTLSVTCERNIMSDIGKLKYSGKSCVRAFIQNVEEFVISRSITYDKILSFAYEIFTDDALHWYRCVKNDVTSWNDLVLRLKEDFSSKDYDYRLLAEIRSRTQGEDESIAIYLSIMHGMFSRLGKSMNEEDKLEVLLHNIRPCYASTLASVNEIKNVDQLKTLCRNYENIQSRLKQFHEPPKISCDTVAPEFAYRSTTFVNTSFKKSYYTDSKNESSYKPYLDNINKNITNYKKIPNIASNANDSSENYQRYCPRCRSDTHSLKQCPKPRFPICFKCGKKGVRFPECPDCNTNQKN